MIEPHSSDNRAIIAAAWVATAVLACGPFSFLVLHDVGGEVWALSGLAGIAVGWATRRRWWPELRGGGELKVCMAILALYLAVSFLNCLLVDDSGFAVSRAKRQLLLIGAPLVFLVLWWLRLRLQTLLVFIALNAVAFGVYALWFCWSFDGRVNGVTHAVHFGNVSLFLGFASLALLPVTRHPGLRALAVAGLILGGCGSVLSGARGGWIASPLLIVVTLVMIVRTFRPGKYLALGLLGVTIMAGVGLWHTDMVRERVDSAVRDYQDLSRNRWLNSIGIRITLWGQAWEEVLEAPIVGTGFSGYRDRMYAAITSGELPKSMVKFSTEPHNEYLYTWATRGAIGLSLLLVSIIWSTWYFIALLRRGDPARLAVAHVGLCLISVVAVGGLTITIIDQREVIRMLGWTLGVLVYGVWLCRMGRASDGQPGS